MQGTTVITCANCGAKNRVPLSKLGQSPKCGRCHQSLQGRTDSAESDGDRNRPGGEILTLRCSRCRAKNRIPVSRLQADPKCGKCGAPISHADALTGGPVIVSDADFENLVLNSPLPVMLYCWAPWCSICAGVNSVIHEIARETRGKIRTAMLNISENPRIAGTFNILSVPYFMIFDAGRLKEQFAGAVPKHDLMMKMGQYLY